MTTDKAGASGRCLRPALQPLRGSTRFAVLGLACIAIAGCGPTYCHEGKLYSDEDRDGVYTRVSGAFSSTDCVVPSDTDGNPQGADAKQAAGESLTAGAEGIAQTPSGDNA